MAFHRGWNGGRNGGGRPPNGGGRPHNGGGRPTYGGGRQHQRKTGVVFRDGGFWTQKRETETAPKSGTTSQEIGEMLGKITDAVSVLADRIEKLERGPDQNSGRSKSDQAKQAGPPTHITSNNDDFASVVKYLYRSVQLEHHAGNWTELPRSLSERLVRFAEDINPPMVDEKLRLTVMKATRAYSDAICEAVREHIDAKRTETTSTAATLNGTDIDRAKEIADRQLSRRLGRRLDDNKRRQLLDQAASTVGSSRRRPEIDADGFETVTNKKKGKAASPSNETPVKKRKLGSPPPVSVHNRFDKLHTLDVEQCDDDDDDHDDNDNHDDNDASAATMTDNVDAQVIDDDDTQVIGDDDANAIDKFLASARNTVQDIAPAAAKQITTVAEVHAEQTVRTRSLSADRARRSTRPSSQVMRTKDGVFVCTLMHKDGYSVVPAADTEVLVVGDSNLRRFSSIPEGWEVHCLPGGKLQHINNALQELSLRCPDNLSLVYVQAGINHRNDTPAMLQVHVEQLQFLNEQAPFHIAVIGVPSPPSLTPKQRGNIDALNAMMSTAFQHKFVPPLADEDVRILQNDTYKIHHNQHSCNKIMTSIREHAHALLNNMLN